MRHSRAHMRAIRAEILRLNEKGVQGVDIAKTLQVSVSTVYQSLGRAGRGRPAKYAEAKRIIRELVTSGAMRGRTLSQLAREIGIKPSAAHDIFHRMGFRRKDLAPLAAAEPLPLKQPRRLATEVVREHLPGSWTAKTCQWIEGEGMCGAAVRRHSSYCEHHHARAYVPQKEDAA